MIFQPGGRRGPMSDVRDPSRHSLPNFAKRGNSNVQAPLLDLKFLIRIAAKDAGTSASAAQDRLTGSSSMPQE
jgi:hypothetical protein